MLQSLFFGKWTFTHRIINCLYCKGRDRDNARTRIIGDLISSGSSIDFWSFNHTVFSKYTKENNSKPLSVSDLKLSQLAANLMLLNAKVLVMYLIRAILQVFDQTSLMHYVPQNVHNLSAEVRGWKLYGPFK